MNPRDVLSRTAFSEIPGWQEDNLTAALSAFRLSSLEMLHQGHAFKRMAALGGEALDWQDVCQAAITAQDARAFFEEHFTPLQTKDTQRPEGLFTGYYEPEIEASLTKGQGYEVPIYAKPDDLVAFTPDETKATGLAYGRRVGGKAEGYFTRQQIEQGALQGRGLEICYAKSWVDVFFMHVQGNGRARLPDGKEIRLSYAAKTGQPYTGIGGVLLGRGIGTPSTMSMQLIRQWADENPDQVRELLWNNKSFVFFRNTEIDNPNLGAIGAAKVNLSPLRSLAVDRAIWSFGTPLFLNTNLPPEAGAAPFHHLMVAQDTGTAIKGIVRGDVYWGWGERQAFVAGHMKSKGTLTALLPKRLAERLLK